MRSRVRYTTTAILEMFPATHLYLGERGRGVVRQPAHPLAGVSVVERVASVGRRQAEVPARLHRRHVLQAERKYSSFRRMFEADRMVVLWMATPEPESEILSATKAFTHIN